MPICINCSHPLPHLYTIYSKADDRNLGKGVRLTQCSNCKRFADKYVEHDYVVLFIDLVLIKPQVYRHLLFNRLNTGTSSGSGGAAIAGRGKGHGNGSRLDPSILRLGILLVLFDVYITWARIEKGSTSPEGYEVEEETANMLTSWPIVGQYIFFLTLNLLSTLAQHVTIRTLARYILPSNHSASTSTNAISSSDLQTTNHTRTTSTNTLATTERPPHDRNTSTTKQPTTDHHSTPYPSGSLISTALLVSSCTKLFPILLVIWPTSSSSPSLTSPSSSTTSTPTSTVSPFATHASTYISWVVLLNNVEALMILLRGSGYVGVTALAVAGFAARAVVEGCLLGLVGLGGGGGGDWGDLGGLVGAVGRGIGVI